MLTVLQSLEHVFAKAKTTRLIPFQASPLGTSTLPDMGNVMEAESQSGLTVSFA